MGLFDLFRRRREPPPPNSTSVLSLSAEGFVMETRSRYGEDSTVRCDWAAISGASPGTHQMKGVDVFTLVPPYLAWIPTDAEGLDALLAELERRGLVGPAEEVTAAWEGKLTGILDELLDRQFGDAGRDQAARLVEPLRATPRLALALVELGGGDLAELRKHAQWAGDEPNDAVYSAWYHKGDTGGSGG